MQKLMILFVVSIFTINPYLYLSNVTTYSTSEEKAIKNVDQEYNAFIKQLSRQEKFEYKSAELSNINEQLTTKNRFLMNENIVDSSLVKKTINDDFITMNSFQNNNLNFSYIKRKNTDEFIQKYNLSEFNNYIEKVGIGIYLSDDENHVILNNEINLIVINHLAIKNQISQKMYEYFALNKENEDLSTIVNYLLFLKEHKASHYVNTLEDVVKQSNKFQSQMNQENQIKNYISNNIWDEYKNEIANEYQPIMTGDSINGWDLVANDYWGYFANTLGTSAISNVISLMLTGKTIGPLILLKLKTLLLNYGVKFLLTNAILSGIAIVGIMAYFAFGQIISSISANKLLNSKIKGYIENNSQEISDLYGFETEKQFRDFLNNGFSIGFLSKLGSLFGVEAIKDRAYMIYDPSLNRNWIIDYVEISSKAHLRNWIGIPYERKNKALNYLSNSSKTFFTAMNGVKVPFVKTYYGLIANSYENHYILEQGINWLTYTSLEIKPSFSKLKLASIKNRFIYETYNVFINQKDFFQDNIDSIENANLKNHFQNILKLINKKQYIQNKTTNSQKISEFEELLYAVYN